MYPKDCQWCSGWCYVGFVMNVVLFHSVETHDCLFSSHRPPPPQPKVSSQGNLIPARPAPAPPLYSSLTWLFYLSFCRYLQGTELKLFFSPDVFLKSLSSCCNYEWKQNTAKLNKRIKHRKTEIESWELRNIRNSVKPGSLE